MENCNGELSVGKTFGSFSEQRRELSAFEMKNFVQLRVVSSRGIEAAKRRAPQKYFRAELEYGEINYACIHGGPFKSKSTGKRPKHS